MKLETAISSLAFLTKKAFLLKAGKVLGTIALIVVPGALTVAIILGMLYKFYKIRQSKSDGETNSQ